MGQNFKQNFQDSQTVPGFIASSVKSLPEEHHKSTGQQPYLQVTQNFCFNWNLLSGSNTQGEVLFSQLLRNGQKRQRKNRYENT